MAHHRSSRPFGLAVPVQPALTLVVDNAAPAGSADGDPAAEPDTTTRFGPPPEFARLVAVHGAPVYRAMGIRPKLRSVPTGRSDSWWWDWAE